MDKTNALIREPPRPGHYELLTSASFALFPTQNTCPQLLAKNSDATRDIKPSPTATKGFAFSLSSLSLVRTSALLQFRPHATCSDTPQLLKIKSRNSQRQSLVLGSTWLLPY